MKRTLLLICTLLCANVLLAQDFFLAGQLYYSVTSNSSVVVYGYNSSNPPTDLVIPETVTYQGTTFNVTEIDELAFCYYYNGDWVQSPCTTLTSVTIPNSVTSIGDEAFYDCSSLTSVTIPNSVTSIGQAAFSGCSSLTSITIPNSVTSIGDEAFLDCSSLTSITIPNSVTSIGDATFYDCSNLSSINIPNSITSIDDWAFGNCSSLTSVTIPNSITSIGNSVFDSCVNLTSVNIPNSVTSIGEQAFLDCSSLTSVTLGNSVTSIGYAAFYNCSSLTSVNIPNSVTSIGDYAFSSCSNLTTLNFNAINCNDFNSGSNHPFYNNPIATINIGDSVQRIPNYFAYDLDFLTSITIPNSVTSIGDNAFNGCRDLTSVTCLGENPSTLGSNAFLDTPLNKVLYFPFCSIENYATSDWSDYFDINIKEGGLTYVYNNNNTLKVINCDDTLTSVVIPSNISNETCSYNVTEIGNNTFYNSSNLTSITIGNNITSIEDSAFYGCSGLATLNFNAINCNDFNSNNHPFVDSPISTITIGENVQRIPNYFAYNNSLITSVNVPNNVSEIGTNAFNGCSNVLSISLGNSVTSLGDSAFYGCSNITSIDIPNSVTEIGADAFNGCDMMMLVNLGENLSFIGSNAFNGCAFLQSVNCLATIPPTLQGSSVFPNPNIATLTVPCGSLEAYSSPTSFWNILFNGRIEEDCEDDSGIEQAETESISFFPNPTKSEITFSQAIEKVEVIDLTGKVIFTFTNAKTINIESLPSGAYYLRLTNEEIQSFRKFIKQ